MRTLTSTLSAYQKKNNLTPLYKIVLTYLTNTYTYDKSRILEIDPHDEQSYSQKATVLLNNSDQVLTALDLKGYEAVISYGYITSQGEEYSAHAPMKVLSQNFDSEPGGLICELELVGIPDMMADDRASETFNPDEELEEGEDPLPEDTNVKGLLTMIVEATLPCFSHCQAYEIIFDSEDDLIDTYYPGSGFRIYTNGSRLAAIRRLLDYTGCSMIVKADGKIHIFVPTTSGTTYDYEYSLSPGSHTFLAKTYEKRLAFPNYVMVKSYDDDDPQYSGVASDAAIISKRAYYQMKLSSDSEAADIARAIVDKARIQAKGGSGQVSINVGAEILDYVQITDSREGDTRTGNIGYIRRQVNTKKKTWKMTFGFGGWTSYKGLINELETYTDVGSSFERLTVENLYAENIQVGSLDIVWIDNEGNIDLSAIGDTLDNLPDGEVYARVKSVHLDEGGLIIDDACVYQTGYDPSTKFDLGTNDLDDVPNGTVYARVQSASLTAGGLVLLDQVSIGTLYGLVNQTDISAGHILLSSTITDSTHRVVTDDDIDLWTSKNRTFYQNSAPTLDMETGDLWFDTDDGYKAYRYSGSAWVTVQDGEISELRTDIDSGDITLSSLTTISGYLTVTSGVKLSATDGILIFGSSTAFRTRATETGTDQCYVGSDGAIYSGAGKVYLDYNGLHINCTSTTLFDIYYGSYHTYLYTNSAGLLEINNGGRAINVYGTLLPPSTSYNLGSTTYPWGYIYANRAICPTRLKIPVGTDMYG